MARVICLYVATLAVSCASAHLHPQIRGRPPCAFDAQRHEIACSNELIARVTCHQPSTPMEGACRALSVEYFSDGAVVWLYNPTGYDPANPRRSSRQYDVAGAYFTIVAADGAYIWFLARSSVLSDRVWKTFHVFAGVVTDLPRADEWRLELAVQQRRAVWLTEKAPADERVWQIPR
jgi:hypothetical protein